MLTELFSVLCFFNLFWISSIFSVVSQNPVYMLIGLILLFFFIGLFFIWSGFTFLGLLVIIVYVGAIAVLFLFVVMMLNVNTYDTNFERYCNFSVNEQKQNSGMFLNKFLLFIFFILCLFDLSVKNFFDYFFLLSYNFSLGFFFEFTKIIFFNFFFEFNWVSFLFLDEDGLLEILGLMFFSFGFAYTLITGFLLLTALLGSIILTKNLRNIILHKYNVIIPQRDFIQSLLVLGKKV